MLKLMGKKIFAILRCRWWLYRAWGRVGTTVGGNKLEKCGSKRSVMDSFMALYAEKTNNEWANRDSFKKFPNKFYPLDIDYGQVKRNPIHNAMFGVHRTGTCYK